MSTTNYEDEVKVSAPAPPTTEPDLNDEWSEMKDSGKRTMNWCFTWNNYTVEDLKAVNEDWLKLPDMRCIMYEPEIAPTTQTPHLQGFFVFSKLKSFKQVKGMISEKVSFSQMRKPIEANIKYCSKEGKAIILGELPLTKAQQGQKGAECSLWRAILLAIQSGKYTYAQIVNMFPEEAIKYSKGLKEAYELHKPKPQFDITTKYATLFDWQSSLLDIVKQPANERTVIWIWSKMGAVGKSDMVKHLISVCNFEPLQNAPTRDIACAWKGGNVVFDYSRSQQDSGLINYDVIEHIKNRLLFSPKYESATKMSEDFKNVFVICFSNKPPDVTKLSKDRWQIFEIEDTQNRTWRQCQVVNDACI